MSADAAGLRGPDVPGGQPPRLWEAPPSGWRGLLFPSIWLVYLGQTVSGLAKHNDGGGIAAGVVILVLFCAVYLIGLIRSVPFRPRAGWWYIAAMLALIGAESVFAHEDAGAMFVYVVVLVVGVTALDDEVRNRRGFVLLVAALAAFGPALVPAWHAPVQWYSGFTVLLVALAMIGFFGLIRSNRALAEARSEVARLAAENERTRIARDLHDLLGHSLTTITVKAGLARRLADRDPDRAAAEIAAVEELSRSSLADVRAAIAGYRDVTLAGELASAHEVLRAAGVRAELPGAVDIVEPGLRTLFGWVVREGVTNVVRHARASSCTITLGPTWVEIVDDGVGGVSDASNGLTGLQERVDAIGGEVTAGGTDGGWRLRVDVPGGSRAPTDDVAAGSRPVATNP